MIKQRISDIGDVILKKSNNEKLPYIEIGDIDVETKKYIRKDKPAVKGAIKAEKDHVIISKVRPTRGAVSIVFEDCLVSNAFVVLQTRESIIPKYLFYSIAYNKRFFLRLGKLEKGTSYPSCRTEDILTYKIPLPTIYEQKEIVQKLEMADNLRQKRKEQLALLDEYLKSVFLDMFGDPMENEKGWRIVKLGDVIIDGPQNGLYKPSGFYGNGVPILRIDCFYDGVVTDITKLKRVVVTYEELRRFQIHEDDIVINRVNSRSHLGKCALIPGISEKTVFESNMMRLTVDKTKVLPLFLSKFLTTPFVKKQILNSAKDAVNQSSINQNDVNNFELFLPPINLQYKFVLIARQVEQTKQKMRDSLDEMDNHFNALMQRYFE
jgi:type I restriction enzyme S subunit